MNESANWEQWEWDEQRHQCIREQYLACSIRSVLLDKVTCGGLTCFDKRWDATWELRNKTWPTAVIALDAAVAPAAPPGGKKSASAKMVGKGDPPMWMSLAELGCQSGYQQWSPRLGPCLGPVFMNCSSWDTEDKTQSCFHNVSKTGRRVISWGLLCNRCGSIDFSGVTTSILIQILCKETIAQQFLRIFFKNPTQFPVPNMTSKSYMCF